MPTPAEAYEAFMVPPFFAPWAERLAERARPAAGAAILDVGSGTGIVARRLAAGVDGGRVVGIDASGEMLAVARAAACARAGRRRMAGGRGRAVAVPGQAASISSPASSR